MILNYTTKIDVDKTVAEITKNLAQHGASAIMTDYDKEGAVVALSFKLILEGQNMGFRLPCDWRPVYEILTKGKKFDNWNQAKNDRQKKLYREQAERTAWRIVKDWVEAQMALVETRMVTVPQVFLPYTVMRDGRTLSETVAHDPKFLLGDGK